MYNLCDISENALDAVKNAKIGFVTQIVHTNRFCHTNCTYLKTSFRPQKRWNFNVFEVLRVFFCMYNFCDTLLFRMGKEENNIICKSKKK